MAYEMVMPYHLHMPSYFLETFTEYPMEDWMNAGHVYYILNETEKSIEYYRKAQELCDSHDEFVRLYQIDKKDLIKQGANEVDLFILPDELI
jgi:tetratricopeptide (TPR) repeat protein